MLDAVKVVLLLSSTHREHDWRSTGRTEEPTDQHQEPERQGELHRSPEEEMNHTIQYEGVEGVPLIECYPLFNNNEFCNDQKVHV